MSMSTPNPPQPDFQADARVLQSGRYLRRSSRSNELGDIQAGTSPNCDQSGRSRTSPHNVIAEPQTGTPDRWLPEGRSSPIKSRQTIPESRGRPPQTAGCGARFCVPPKPVGGDRWASRI